MNKLWTAYWQNSQIDVRYVWNINRLFTIFLPDVKICLQFIFTLSSFCKCKGNELYVKISFVKTYDFTTQYIVWNSKSGVQITDFVIAVRHRLPSHAQNESWWKMRKKFLYPCKKKTGCPSLIAFLFGLNRKN